MSHDSNFQPGRNNTGVFVNKGGTVSKNEFVQKVFCFSLLRCLISMLKVVKVQKLEVEVWK